MRKLVKKWEYCEKSSKLISIQVKESSYKELQDWFEAVHNIHKRPSLTFTIVFHLPLSTQQTKKIVFVTNIGGHLPSLFPPFQVTPKGLVQMDRHHTTHEIKFTCSTILEDELAENVIKLL